MSLQILANNGWYMPFDFDPGEVNYYAKELSNNNPDPVNKSMVDFLNDSIEDIESYLIERFPTRGTAIKAAIRAHKSREYYLSIPVFFAQIEGISKELIGKRFFKLKHNKPSTGKWVTSYFNSDTILGLLLKPLEVKGIARENQDFNNPTGLNRHDVLHGDSLDYGDDKLNSYKALSLLNYIGDVVYVAIQDMNNRKSISDKKN